MIRRVCVLSLLLLSVRSYEVSSYSQVATGGSAHADGPKVYKALNMDLIFPKTFNSSENVISTTQTSAPRPVVTEDVESLSSTADEQFTPERISSQASASQPLPEPEAEVPAANDYPTSFVTPNNHADESEESEATLPPSATGRAVDYRPAYPFAQLLTPNRKGYNRPSAESYPVRSRPLSRPSTTGQRIVYPSYQAPRIPSRAEIDKLSGKGQFSDRFTPSEAVASGAFKQTQTRNRKPSISRPVGQPSNKVSSFVPTKDLYTFPPNLNSRYPSPSDIKQASPSDTVTSYLPPATGPLDTSKFVGPVNPDLLQGNKGDAKDMAGGGYNYEPPQPPLDANLGQKDNDQGPPPPPPPPMDDGGMMDAGPPPPSDDGDTMDDFPPQPDHDHDQHDYPHDYPHDAGGYADDKEYPTPPPGYLEDHDDHDFHHHHHHPDYEYSHGPYFHDHHHDHYPDVYDDYHDHHFHHDHIIEHHPEPEPTTTMAPPPPPPPPAPEQPRVKKYSYFYIGRKLWYIPLYFTLWFTIYILWLILKSIARHKVNLPNHYVSRRSIDDLNHREAREAIDKLTCKVMDGIESFKLKYIG